MACPSEDAITRFVDGTLSDPGRDDVAAHLAGCDECRALVSEIARALAARQASAGGGGASSAAPALDPLTDEPPRRTFEDGAIVGDRYRIERFVARGGMGEVYCAEDRELHARVALKTVRPEIAAQPKVLVRFKREVFLARKVTHENVCRLFDMGFHARGGDRIAFLTMELLQGETLDVRLRRGRMELAEARPIVEQLVAGLSAAHREGVVHGDFKSPNVMLSRRDGGMRAVITDFGLARGAGGEHFGAATTDPERLIGSPAYMAPEQVAGFAVEAAADLYALGVVMFEMVTGAWPFVGPTAMLTAVKRLNEPAPSPRTLVPGLDARWEAAILRCLAREPEDRFARADEVLEALDRPAPATARGPSRRSRARWLVPLLLAGAGAIAAVVGLSRHARVAPAAAPAPPAAAPAPPAAAPPAAAPPAAAIEVAPPPAAPRKWKPPDRPRPRPKPSDHALDHFILKYPGR